MCSIEALTYTSLAFPFTDTKTVCAPHEIQQENESPAFGPSHPAGAIADENVSQSFRRQARHPFVSDATPGTRRGGMIEKAAHHTMYFTGQEDVLTLGCPQFAHAHRVSGGLTAARRPRFETMIPQFHAGGRI